MDVLTATTLRGWAIDANDAGQAVEVRYSIDGNAPAFVAAGDNRPDLQGPYGSTAHGFSVTLPGLAAGLHTIAVYAVDNDNKALVLLGVKTVAVSPAAGQHLPKGSLDVATSGRIAGWVYDADAGPQAIQARVDIDGAAGTPFTASASRPDLVPLFGTDQLGVNLLNPGPGGTPLSAGPHRIDLYAIDQSTGKAVLIASRIINNTLTFGAVDGLSASGMTGWAWAQGTSDHHAQVRVDVDGMAGALVTANVAKPSVAAALGGGTFGFSADFKNVGPGLHRVAVWLLNPVTDNVVLLFMQPIVIA
jgi:hypothetical protein